MINILSFFSRKKESKKESPRWKRILRFGRGKGRTSCAPNLETLFFQQSLTPDA